MAADEPARSDGRRSSKTPEPREADGGSSQESVVNMSILQPRVAVVLGVPKRWYPLLTICRLLSIAPTLWWGIRLALRLLVIQILDLSVSSEVSGESSIPAAGPAVGAGDALDEISRLAQSDRSLKLVETVLAMIWVSAIGW